MFGAKHIAHNVCTQAQGYAVSTHRAQRLSLNSNKGSSKIFDFSKRWKISCFQTSGQSGGHIMKSGHAVLMELKEGSTSFHRDCVWTKSTFGSTFIRRKAQKVKVLSTANVCMGSRSFVPELGTVLGSSPQNGGCKWGSSVADNSISSMMSAQPG